MSRFVVDGAGYAVRVAGDERPLLLLHGFTGSSADWAPLLPELGRMTRSITVDLLGHGASDSPADPARHAVERQAADIAEILRGLGAAPAIVYGYSMGARVALRLAVTAPDAVERLVLESPSAGIADPAEGAARRASDEELARLLERDGIAAFVERWESLPLFASERVKPAEWHARVHAERLRNSPAGLAASLRGAGQGSMEPLRSRLAGVDAPTLVIAGELDATGAARARTVAAGIPGARLHVITGTGHAPHREAPELVLPLLLDFIAAERKPA